MQSRSTAGQTTSQPGVLLAVRQH